EALRSTVDPADDGWVRRTVPAGGVEVFATEVGWMPGAHANARIADIMASLSPLAWPHCAFVTVVDPDQDGFVLVMGADHSVMDAYSQALWPAETVELYRRAAGLDGREWTDQELADSPAASHVDHAATEAEQAAGLDADSEAVARWREFLGEDLSFPHVPTVALAEEQRPDLPQCSLSETLADETTTDALARLCKAAGTSLQYGVLAAMSLAFRRRYGVERLRYVLPMHTRTSLEHAIAVGWYVGLCPADVDITGSEDLLTAAGVVHREIAAQRDLVAHPFPRIAELLQVASGPRFVVSYIDGRFIPGADEWDEWDGQLLRSPAYSDEEFYLWFSRTDENIRINARYPSSLAAERTMRGLVTDLRAILAEAAVTDIPGLSDIRREGASA
ncbi:MAG: condensation domain-containing protein, partial [Micrococcales bacterium]|nr:condensation domain-containing protein [Micrococcales bacterium]